MWSLVDQHDVRKKEKKHLCLGFILNSIYPRFMYVPLWSGLIDLSHMLNQGWNECSDRLFVNLKRTSRSMDAWIVYNGKKRSKILFAVTITKEKLVCLAYSKRESVYLATSVDFYLCWYDERSGVVVAISFFKNLYLEWIRSAMTIHQRFLSVFNFAADWINKICSFYVYFFPIITGGGRERLCPYFLQLSFLSLINFLF